MHHSDAAMDVLSLPPLDVAPEDRPTVERRVAYPEMRDDGAVSKRRRTKEECRSVPTAVVDRSALYRVGIAHILANTRFDVVANCASLGELPENLLSNEEFVLLLGLGDDKNRFLSETIRLKENYNNMRIVVVSDRFSPEDALAAISAGANCYLVRDELGPDLLLRSLEVALLGPIVVYGKFAGTPSDWCVPLVAERVAAPAAGQEVVPSPAAPGPEPQSATPRLSGRERLILSRLMQGASNKHIARDLDIAEATVKVHVKSLLRKIRVQNRTQAAMWGINNLQPATTDRDREMDCP